MRHSRREIPIPHAARASETALPQRPPAPYPLAMPGSRQHTRTSAAARTPPVKPLSLPSPQTLEHFVSLFVSNGSGGSEEEADESRTLFVGKIPAGRA
jgi:hypothetical protein